MTSFCSRTNDQDQDPSGYSLKSTSLYNSFHHPRSSLFRLLFSNTLFSNWSFIDTLLPLDILFPLDLLLLLDILLHASSHHIQARKPFKIVKRWTKVLSRSNNEIGSSKRWISLMVGKETLTNPSYPVMRHSVEVTSVLEEHLRTRLTRSCGIRSKS